MGDRGAGGEENFGKAVASRRNLLEATYSQKFSTGRCAIRSYAGRCAAGRRTTNSCASGRVQYGVMQQDVVQRAVVQRIVVHRGRCAIWSYATGRCAAGRCTTNSCASRRCAIWSYATWIVIFRPEAKSPAHPLHNHTHQPETRTGVKKRVGYFIIDSAQRVLVLYNTSVDRNKVA